MDPENNENLTALSSAIDQIGQEQEPAEQNDRPEPIEAEAKEGEQIEAKADEPSPSSKLAAMLDGMTEDPNGAQAKAAKAAETEVKAKTEGKPADGATDGAPNSATNSAPKAPEQEEAELLEGVKSERGKERIKQVFADKKALESDMGEFRALVQNTGMNAQEFAKTLEFGRLVNSGDEKNLRVALEMIEDQRTMLYSKLGVEAPGIDLLAGHDDLKSAVENMEITRDKAVELVKYRKADSDKKATQQAAEQATQNRQQFDTTVQSAAGTMDAYLTTRTQEVDHLPRMKVLSDHFKDPAKMQKFVTTYRPEQWAATVQMMYDSIQVPRAPVQSQPQPIRSRPATLGTPTAGAGTPIDRVAQRMEAMGL
jgi:hypothetical protein